MKPRPDLAPLKRLHSRKREQIWRWLNGDPEKGILPLSQKTVVARIKKRWGVKITGGDLSKFYSEYPLSLELREATSFKEHIHEYLSTHPDINLDADTISKVGQILFEKRAIQKGDPKLFIGLRRLRQKDLDQMMDRDRFEIESIERFLKWNSMARMKELADSDLPHSDKIAAMRRVAFQDVDAAEKKGVTLPAA